MHRLWSLSNQLKRSKENLKRLEILKELNLFQNSPIDGYPLKISMQSQMEAKKIYVLQSTRLQRNFILRKRDSNSIDWLMFIKELPSKYNTIILQNILINELYKIEYINLQRRKTRTYNVHTQTFYQTEKIIVVSINLNS